MIPFTCLFARQHCSAVGGGGGLANGGGLAGWLLIALLTPGLLVLIGVVVSFALRRPRPQGQAYFHVRGYDQITRLHRELTVQAQSIAGARGRAEMEGMVVIEVKGVQEDE